MSIFQKNRNKTVGGVTQDALRKVENYVPPIFFENAGEKSIVVTCFSRTRINDWKKKKKKKNVPRAVDNNNDQLNVIFSLNLVII